MIAVLVRRYVADRSGCRGKHTGYVAGDITDITRYFSINCQKTNVCPVLASDRGGRLGSAAGTQTDASPRGPPPLLFYRRHRASWVMVVNCSARDGLVALWLVDLGLDAALRPRRCQAGKFGVPMARAGKTEPSVVKWVTAHPQIKFNQNKTRNSQI